VIGSATRSEVGRHGGQPERGYRDGHGGPPTAATGPPLTRTAVSPRAAAVLASSRALVCGILNATPDSFYDGGRYIDQATAVEHGRRPSTRNWPPPSAASVFRVHDVAATRDVLALLAAVEHREEPL
jgi:hypothetical protein